jgi:hypothetical protein
MTIMVTAIHREGEPLGLRCRACRRRASSPWVGLRVIQRRLPHSHAKLARSMLGSVITRDEHDTKGILPASLHSAGAWTRSDPQLAGGTSIAHAGSATSRATLMTLARVSAGTPVLIGWGNTPRTWRPNPGSSSRQSMPWCARDPSPGMGT